MANLSQIGHERAVNRLLSYANAAPLSCVRPRPPKPTIIVVHAQVPERKSRGRWADRISSDRTAGDCEARCLALRELGLTDPVLAGSVERGAVVGMVAKLQSGMANAELSPMITSNWNPEFESGCCWIRWPECTPVRFRSDRGTARARPTEVKLGKIDYNSTGSDARP